MIPTVAIDHGTHWLEHRVTQWSKHHHRAETACGADPYACRLMPQPDWPAVCGVWWAVIGRCAECFKAVQLDLFGGGG